VTLALANGHVDHDEYTHGIRSDCVRSAGPRRRGRRAVDDERKFRQRGQQAFAPRTATMGRTLRPLVTQYRLSRMDVNGSLEFLFAAGSRSWTAHRLAGQIAALRQSGLSCRDIACEIVHRFDPGDSRALGDALRDVCEQADRSGTSNAFHNPAHSRDVGVIWFNLALANNRLAAIGSSPSSLTSRDLLIGACAAFGHDIGHDGTANVMIAVGDDGVERSVRTPFRLETLAADRVCDIMHCRGATASDLSAVRAMILSTDIEGGHRALDLALGIDPDAPPEPIPHFASFSDPSVRLMAAILRDADIMPSAGLTLRDCDRYSRLIELELGLAPMSLGPVQTERFFGAILHRRFVSPPGQLFQSRLDALGAINRIRLADRDLQDLDLESTGRDMIASS